jgi:hypothetical protein
MYHVMVRGIERDAVFRNDADRDHCLELGKLTTYQRTLFLRNAPFLSNHNYQPLCGNLRRYPNPVQEQVSATK